ncbi:MAG: (Fe-S)-binding protein [Gammaproteobacteria bacterium]|nr:(Fe-S)-binding protein [Gammaproteobacteria bacterium]
MTKLLDDYLSVPPLAGEAMAGTAPYRAAPEHNEPLGFPGQLVDNWQEAAITKMGELVSNSRPLRVFMDACIKCGACTDKCHYYLGTADPKNMPVARQDLFRNVYRRYFTVSGKYLPWLVGARDFDETVLNDWYTYFHQCSQCRRCSVYCPMGIDTAEISMAAREIMDSIGMGQKYSNEVIAKVHAVGNNLGLPGPALADTLAGLEEDVLEDDGIAVRFPLDQAGAEVLLVTPSADFFAEPHVDGLIGYAKVFHQAGISWTVSSMASEAANFGLFIGSFDNMKAMALRIREAALELGVRRIVFGECGHAWRVAYNFLHTLAGPFDFLDKRYPVPQHIVEVTHALLTDGALKVDASANDGRRVTFHDSCNIARASGMGGKVGGQFTLPREVLRAVCNDFFDMPRETTGEATFCCGGGGGLLTDELMELRVKGALPRMQALAAVHRQHRITHMAAICAICKSQFAQVLPQFGFEFDQVISLHQLVGDALQFDATA